MPAAVDPRPLLVVLGWYLPGTGFTRVLEALIARLSPHYRIRWYGIAYREAPRLLAPGVELLPTNLRGGDLLGVYALAGELPALGACAVLALHDVWHLATVARVLGPVRGATRLVGYFPLDGRPPDNRELLPLAGFDALATYTDWACDAIAQVWPPAHAPLPLHRVGHGAERGPFRPSPALAEAGFDRVARTADKAAMFPALPEPERSWIVLNASRPDRRKRLDLSIAGFAQFARCHPHVYLCLHHALRNDDIGAAVRAQAEHLGIGARLLFPADGERLADARLAQLYRACDVGLNTAMGEGFGLVSLEHAACGAAQVLPDHGALREIWGDAATCVPIARRIVPPFSPFEMGEVAPAAVAAALHALYDDPLHERALAQRACARAHAPEFGWDRVAADLGRLLVETTGNALRSATS